MSQKHSPVTMKNSCPKIEFGTIKLPTIGDVLSKRYQAIIIGQQ